MGVFRHLGTPFRVPTDGIPFYDHPGERIEGSDSAGGRGMLKG